MELEELRKLWSPTNMSAPPADLALIRTSPSGRSINADGYGNASSTDYAEYWKCTKPQSPA